MIKKLGFIAGTLISTLIVVGLFLPAQYNVSRSIMIHASQESIHQYVGELKNWEMWTPWKELDPTVITTLGKKTSGIGATQSWTSKEGGGSLTLTMSSPDKGIKYDLLFGKDADKCESAVEYTLLKEKTRVTWSMQGEISMPVVGGYFAFMMDSMVGDTFDRGLAKLKTVAEQG